MGSRLGQGGWPRSSSPPSGYANTKGTTCGRTEPGWVCDKSLVSVRQHRTVGCGAVSGTFRGRPPLGDARHARRPQVSSDPRDREFRFAAPRRASAARSRRPVGVVPLTMAADSSSNAAWSETPSSRAPRRLPVSASNFRVACRRSIANWASARPSRRLAAFSFFARFICSSINAIMASSCFSKPTKSPTISSAVIGREPRHRRRQPHREGLHDLLRVVQLERPQPGPHRPQRPRHVRQRPPAGQLEGGRHQVARGQLFARQLARPGEFAGFGAQAANPAKSPAGLGWGKLRRPLGDGACGARGSTAPHGQCRLAVRRHLDAVRATRRRPRMAPDVDHDGDQARRIWRRHLAVRVDRECCRILYGW